MSDKIDNFLRRETKRKSPIPDIQSVLNQLRGFDGADGKDGKDGVGIDGKDGKDGRDGAKGDKGDSGKDGVNGKDGKDGVGRDGKDGKNGIDGKEGLSAYQVWLANGNRGSVDDYLKSLRGPRGTSGGGMIGQLPHAFKKIAVSGQTTLTADRPDDALTLVAGSNVTITTNATNDSITIASSGGGGGGGGVSDGDKGDITVSSSGAVWTIDADSVTYDKMQDTSGTDVLLGRSTAGAGTIEEVACTAAGRALLDDATAADQRTTLGLGTLATQSGTFSGASSGTNTGDQTSVTGNAGTATALQNARTIGGVSFDGTANITVATATGGFTVSGGDLAVGANIKLLGSSTGANTFTALNASATDYTTSVPAVTGVMASTSGSNLFISDIFVASSSLTKNADTAFADIPGLVGDIAIGTYRIRAYLPSTVASAGGGIKYCFHYTNSAVLSSIQVGAIGTTPSATGSQQTTSTADQAKIVGFNALVVTALIEGTFVVSTAGTISIQMAQNTSNASNTVALVGGYMELTRIA